MDFRGLRSSQVISFIDSTFRGDLDLSGSDLGHDLSLLRSSVEGIFSLKGTRVRGTVDLGGDERDSQREGVGIGSFKKKMDLTRVDIEKDLNIIHAKVEDSLEIVDAHIGSTVSIMSSEFSEKAKTKIRFSDLDRLTVNRSSISLLDLTGSVMRRELRLGTINWVGESKLVLRVATTNFLIGGGNDGWPHVIDLRGFSFATTYTSASENNEEGILGWEAGEILVWLSKQPEPRDYQPYQLMAKLLRSAGYEEKAEKILYQMKEEQRECAIASDNRNADDGFANNMGADGKAAGNRCSKGFWVWFGLTISKHWSGYNIYPERVFRFGGVLIIIGILALWKQDPFKDSWKCAPPVILKGRWREKCGSGLSLLIDKGVAILFYSVDRFMPLVRLRDHMNPSIVPSGLLAYWFHVQQIMGYFTFAYFIAGLSGLFEK